MASSRRKTNFGSILKEARKQRDWTQIHLSERAAIATRTIVTAEKGVRPRKDIVIRLAYALGVEISEWLEMCGYPAATPLEINKTIKEAGRLHFAGERDPEAFFRELAAKTKDGRKYLMCVAYVSAPGASGHQKVKELIVQLIESGISLAMCCPYVPVAHSEKTTKPDLFFYHNQVYNKVVGFCREVRDQLSSLRQNHISVFVPDFSESNQRLGSIVPPPVGAAVYRPTLIIDLDSPQKTASHELAMWFIMRQDGRDRWLTIYPAPSPDDEQVGIEHLGYWRDYFRDVSAALTSEGWDRSKLTNSGWRLEFPN